MRLFGDSRYCSRAFIDSAIAVGERGLTVGHGLIDNIEDRQSNQALEAETDATAETGQRRGRSQKNLRSPHTNVRGPEGADDSTEDAVPGRRPPRARQDDRTQLINQWEVPMPKGILDITLVPLLAVAMVSIGNAQDGMVSINSPEHSRSPGPSR